MHAPPGIRYNGGGKGEKHMPAVGVAGIEELKRRLEALGRNARAKLPAIGARALAALSIESFRNPGLRPSPWPPLAASTLGRAGAGHTAAAKARKRAAEFRDAALGAEAAATGTKGKAREKALAAASKARAKAREWSGRAKAAKAEAIAGKTMLVDTGNMRAGIMASGPAVNVSAGAGKGRFPYPAVHQFGSKTVPARPFIPVLPDGKMSPLAEKRLKAALSDALSALSRNG